MLERRVVALLVRLLALPRLWIVFCTLESAHLLLVHPVGLLVVYVRLIDLATVIVSDLELAHPPLLLHVHCLQFVVLLLIHIAIAKIFYVRSVNPVREGLVL